MTIKYDVEISGSKAAKNKTKDVFLQPPLKINDPEVVEIIGTDFVDWLKKQYKKYRKDSSSSKAVISVISAIITNQTGAFFLTRNSLQKIVYNDPNWKVKNTFSNRDYSYILRTLQDGGTNIIKRHRSVEKTNVDGGISKKASLYVLVKENELVKSILETIEKNGISIEKQLEECVSFHLGRPVEKLNILKREILEEKIRQTDRELEEMKIAKHFEEGLGDVEDESKLIEPVKSPLKFDEEFDKLIGYNEDLWK